jgi:uncharacterized protein YbjT (DUF2867 family)
VSGNGRAPALAVAGATGFVGRRLVPALLRRGHPVRCLVRDAQQAARVLPGDAELIEADLERPDGLAAKLEGTVHAHFLVHLMDQGPDYAERERTVALNFARAALTAGVKRVSYLGGLGERSPHLASRQATAQELADCGPPLTHFRAAMIVGPGSESYELLRAIVDRLPVAPSPKWLDNHTQPLGSRDLVAYLRDSPLVPEAAGRSVEIGGPDVLSHREVIEELAHQMGVRGPRWLPVGERIARPQVMAAGAATLTYGDPAVAAELALGLQEKTIVTDPSGAELFDVRPERLGTVFQRCLHEEERANA